MSEHDAIVAKLKPIFESITGSELTFNCFSSMQGEFIAHNHAQKTLIAKFPFLDNYKNPLGNMQGGFTVAAMDNTLGPLCYLSGTPGVTTQLNISYVRPVTPRDEYILVRASITAQTQNQTFIEATVTNIDEKIIAIAHSTFVAQFGKKTP